MGYYYNHNYFEVGEKAGEGIVRKLNYEEFSEILRWIKLRKDQFEEPERLIDILISNDYAETSYCCETDLHRVMREFPKYQAEIMIEGSDGGGEDKYYFYTWDDKVQRCYVKIEFEKYDEKNWEKME